jgi:hypothetical protein
MQDGESMFVYRVNGKLDGLFKFATLENGRWIVNPGLQEWLAAEHADNVYVGASFEEPL